jgi:putative molybdopterin biosynthesis protein
MEMEKIYTAKEVAEYLKVKKDTIYKWIRDGDLKCSQIGRTVRITESQLADFLKPKEKEEDNNG